MAQLLLLKVERLSVYAVAEAGFVFGTIVEDVTKVSAAFGTHNFGAGHAVSALVLDTVSGT